MRADASLARTAARSSGVRWQTELTQVNVARRSGAWIAMCCATSAPSEKPTRWICPSGSRPATWAANSASEVRARSGGHFDLPEGTIYPALHRLELAGLLSSRWVQPDGGRKRRVYALTEDGRRSLVERRAGWQSFASGIDLVLGSRA